MPSPRLRDVTTDKYIARLPADLPADATLIHAGRPARVVWQARHRWGSNHNGTPARLEYLDPAGGSLSATLAEINGASVCTGCGRKAPSCKCWTAYDILAAREGLSLR